MASQPKNFYNRNFPFKGEIVRIIMTKLNETAVECILPDFNNQTGIILLSELSHQKRFRKGRSSIRNYFHENKTVCAKVTASDENKKTIILTRRYQDEWKKKAKMLLVGNNRLITIVNTLTRKIHSSNKKDKDNLQNYFQEKFDSIWEELIYPLINNIEQIKSEEQIIIYHYLEKNINEIKIQEKYHQSFIDSMKKYIKKTEKKYKSRFGIISIDGIEETKKVLLDSCNKLEINKNMVTYDGESGYWKLTTLNYKNSDAEMIHNNFIHILKEEIANKKFHIKIDYIASN